jgi:hemerythrin
VLGFRSIIAPASRGSRRGEKLGGGKMAGLQWRSEFSVGVHAMDEEHIALFALFNDVCASIEDGHGRAESEPLLRKMIDLTQQHFRSEETLLASKGFPGAARHGDHHKDLGTLMKEYLVRFDRGDLGSSTNLLNFLRQWIVHHVETEDKAYGVWLNRHGVH